MKTLSVTLNAAVMALLGLAVVFSLTTSQAHAAVLADGLVSYWNMDQGSGTTATDVANGHNGTLMNGTGWIASNIVIGSTFSTTYDGVDDFVQIADTVDLDLTGNLSISGWVRTTSTGTQVIARKTFAYEVFVYNGHLAALLGDGSTWSGSDIVEGAVNITDGNWHHVVMTYSDSTDTLKLYVDGVLDVSNTAYLVSVGANANDLYFGADGQGSNFYLNGGLDEMRVYARVLSDAEIASLHSYVFSIDLSPNAATNTVATSHTVTAAVSPAVGFVPVLFELSGANSGGGTPYIYTNGSDVAAFTYTGTNAGVDTIIGCIDVSWFVTGGGVCDQPFDEPSDSVTKTWVVANHKISGTKYEDSNGNGVRDGVEAGLSSWTIFIDLNADKTLNGAEVSTTTDALGYYQFLGLPDATYSICEVIPSTWSQTQPGTPAVPTCYSVTLAGADANGKDFGNFKLVSVSGHKYYSTTTVGLAGWTILNDGLPATTTIADGSYSFLLGPGTHTICETLIAGWAQTLPAPGVSCGTNGNGYSLTATSGVNVANQDFSNYLKPLPPISIKKKDFQATSTIPVKFSSPADSFSPAKLFICPIGVAYPNAACKDAVSSGNSNTLNNFRYTGGQYIFNLSTKMPIFTKGSSYDLWVTLNGIGTFYFATITIKP